MQQKLFNCVNTITHSNTRLFTDGLVICVNGHKRQGQKLMSAKT